MSQIKDKSYQIKKCQANQVLPEECDMLLQPSILLTLQCAKNGATSKQVNTAISQGEKRVKASISASPYQQIKRKLDKSPFFIHPEKANFIVYSRQCADYKDKLFRIVAYTINDGQAKFVASPIKPTTCLSTTNLDKKYPILSARQLDKFSQGYYLEQSPSAERFYENIEVMVADSLADAGHFFSKMTKKERLIINTEPENANIKIVGLKKPYKKGMKLNVGEFTIRVSSSGYNTRELKIHLKEPGSTFNVKLDSSIEQVVCQEKLQKYPVEFINRHYIKKINNCTYQLSAAPVTDTPFKFLVTKNSHKSKHLVKVRLGIAQYDPSENIVSLSVVELKPRLAKIDAGSSGISDVPESIGLKKSSDFEKMKTRLTILDATFSH
ncbi:MAG: hypothetical protein QNL62_06020 [Gammaproteobacteria bacterium]|nr:hypothetical protein [Gammaproteobacteria bacterium]